jgi:hypothetical protein
MYQYLVNDHKGHPEHNPSTAEKDTLHGPVPNQLVFFFDKKEDNPRNRWECGSANPRGDIGSETGIATGVCRGRNRHTDIKSESEQLVLQLTPAQRLRHWPQF